MKAIFLLVFFLSISALTPLRAADNLQETFQRGLFEEEGNHNLPAAIKAYESVLSQLDQQRKIAATTVFRLGECYRKLGKTNEATAQYQRVLREFSDQDILAKLSQQNLAGLSGTPANTAKASEVAAAPNEEAVEIERIRTLIKDSPDLINAPGKSGYTPLQSAVERGQLSVAAFLLKNGANPNERGNRIPPLMIAADSGLKSMVELLLSHKADVNAAAGSTALHKAVGKGFRSVAEVLLAAGANVNAEDGSSDVFHAGTPLRLAIQRADVTLAELLIARGADVNAANRSGVTPLHFATSRGAVESAAILLKHGANVDARITSQNISIPGFGSVTAQGCTSLHFAAIQGRLELAKLLITNKANVNAISSQERTPLNLASEFATAEMVGLLLQHGAEVNKLVPGDASSPLHHAVKKQDREMVEVILSFKPKLELRDTNGQTPLQWAALSRDARILEMLLEAGADPNVTHRENATPLHFAVQSRNRQMAEALVKHRADVFAVDANGRTAFDYTTTVRPGQQPDTVLAEIGELLRDAAAQQEASQRTSMIRIGREGTYFNGFSRAKNDLNRYTLFELLAFYVANQSSSVPFAFPDFSRIVIRRIEGGAEKKIALDLDDALQQGDCSKDIWLEWGDKVDIAEKDHKLNEAWTGLSVEAAGTLRKCLQRKVQIIVKGETTELTLDPFGQRTAADRTLRGAAGQIPSRVSAPGSAEEQVLLLELQRAANQPLGVQTLSQSTPIPRSPINPVGISSQAVQPSALEVFQLSAVLRSANVLRTSSDLTRVKVKRTEPTNHATKEIILNLEDAAAKNDLWLRDGDVIEVPDKNDR